MRGRQHPYRTRDAAPQGGEYLDVVIFGACDHQVVVARCLVHCEAHHRPNVATELPHGLQPGGKGTGQPLLPAGAHPHAEPPPPALECPSRGCSLWGRAGRETPFPVIPGEECGFGVCQHLAAQPESANIWLQSPGCSTGFTQPIAHWAGSRTRQKQGPDAHPTCLFPSAKLRQTLHPTQLQCRSTP